VKLLLDECVPIDSRHRFPGHETHTAQWAGLKGKKNGELLRAAESAGYDVLLTVDHNLTYQQNLTGRELSISIRSSTNQLEDLLLMVDVILEALKTIIPGEVVIVG
jgi:hypothetical protein